MITTYSAHDGRFNVNATNVNEERMTVTEAAAAKAAQLLASQQTEEAAVRVFIKSGGCSGYSYGMSIDDRRLEFARFRESGFPLVDCAHRVSASSIACSD
jgi:Fe-S cluster assembly iron-binding protein IscA